MRPAGGLRIAARTLPSVLAILLQWCIPSSAWPSEEPILRSLEPAGVTVGAAAYWVASGRNLGGCDRAVVTGEGVEVERVEAAEDGTVIVRVRATERALPGFREVVLLGRDGVSNPVRVRVDPLPEVSEVEPNDEPAQAQVVPEGTTVAGRLDPLDVDHVRVRLARGRRVTLEVESFRLGSPIEPVLTITAPSGRAIAQIRRAPGGDGECRGSLLAEDGGDYLLRFHDNTYRGGEGWRYRLRIDPAPYATGIAPLGGPAGSELEVTLSGGSLSDEVRIRLALPDQPGSRTALGPFLTPRGMVLGSGWIESDRLHRSEGAGAGSKSVDAGRLRAERSIDGILAHPGEVDRHRVELRAGERVRIRVRAAELGSWLDSVLVVRDESGRVVAEDDDVEDQGGVDGADGTGGATDSRIDLAAAVHATYEVEVADRYGRGGPEYSYRLAAIAPGSEFEAELRLEPHAAGRLPGLRTGDGGTGRFGRFNLDAGTACSVPLEVRDLGPPPGGSERGTGGPVRVRVEGLPPGVTAEPVALRPAGPRRPGVRAGMLRLRAARDARAGFGCFRVSVTRTGPDGPEEREAFAEVGSPVEVGDGSAAGRSRRMTRFPLAVLPREVDPRSP